MTLIDTAIACGVLAVLVGTAAPSFSGSFERHGVESAAAQFETDVQFARGEAIARAASVRIAFQSDAAGTCYVVHTGATGDCRCDATGRPVCTGQGQPLRTAFLPAAQGLKLTSNVRTMTVDAQRHTFSPTGTVTVAGKTGKSLQEKINILGRASACSPGKAIAGYKACA